MRAIEKQNRLAAILRPRIVAAMELIRAGKLPSTHPEEFMRVLTRPVGLPLP